MSLLERDDARGELEHREVVGGDAFPADQQAAESVVPTVRALDDPTTRFAAHASDEWLLSATTNVRDDASTSNSGFAVGVVVSLVQAQMARAKRNEHVAKHNCIKRVCDQPLVVDVGAGDQHGQRHTAAVGENMSFHAQFSAIRRVFPCGAPPLGAFTMALSSDAKSHLMPRRLS